VHRVVTLAPNLTEMVFAVGAGGKLIGADDHSNYPADAARLPKVGGMQPDIEKIVSLRPDLVLASTEGNHPNLAPALAAAGVPLFVVRTDRVAEIPVAMRRIGGLLGAPGTEQAVSLLEEGMRAQRRTRATKLRVLFAVWTDPLFAAGRETFTDDIFSLAGAVNAVELRGWPQYSLEAFIAAPPDILLYPSGSVSPAQIEELLKRAPGVQVQAIAVDQDVFQRPGPRMVEAARRLNEILGAFEEKGTTETQRQREDDLRASVPLWFSFVSR
jgi:iron complex transport system substrate-binding protein